MVIRLTQEQASSKIFFHQIYQQYNFFIENILIKHLPRNKFD